MERAQSSMTGSLAGRSVVVTGGARGIGAAILREFVAVDAHGVSLDLEDPEEELRGVRYLTADVSDRASVEAAFRELDTIGQSIDVLVNNAGIQRVGVTDEIDPDHWRAVVGTHLFGTFHCSAAAIARMKQHGRGGAIVTIASAAAIVGLPGRGPYSASKAGMLGLTRVMAVELAEQGVRVNAVAPGFTRTRLIDRAIQDGSLQEDWMVAQVPMRRLAAPEEIARVVRFLASDDASYITGQCIVVDGGWTIQGIGGRPDWLGGAS